MFPSQYGLPPMTMNRKRITTVTLQLINLRYSELDASNQVPIFHLRLALHSLDVIIWFVDEEDLFVHEDTFDDLEACDPIGDR